MFLLSGDSMKLSGNIWSTPRPFYKDAGFTGKPLEEGGYMLLSRYNSTLGESVIELVDLSDFSVIHTWNPDISEAHSKTDLRKEEFQDLIRDRSEQRYLIMHPYLNSDGSIILHGNYTPLMKIDHCGDLVWLNQEENFHHSIESDSEGNYWVPTRMFPTKISPDIVGAAFENFYDDAITKISPEGEIIYQKSVSEIFIENDMSYLLFSVGDQDEFITDPIHLNDIQPALSDSEYWQKGDLFLSLRHQSMIVQYRPSTNEVIWTGAGHFYHQHDIDFLDDKTISIFNNNSKDYFEASIVDGFSDVVIYNFSTNAYSKYLKASTDEHRIKSATEGRSEILPNGDLFIEETNYGRTVYFDANGDLRWQHVNVGEDGNVYRVAWSRVIYQKNEIEKIKEIRKCDAKAD
jgi:hypothetical protein